MKTLFLPVLFAFAASSANAEPAVPQKDLFGARPALRAYESRLAGTQNITRVQVEPSQGVIARTRIAGEAMGVTVEVTMRHWNWLVPTLYEAKANGAVRNRMEPAKIELVKDNWPSLAPGAAVTLKVTDESNADELITCTVRPAIRAATLNPALSGESFPVECVPQDQSEKTVTHFLKDYGFGFTSSVGANSYELIGVEK